MWLKNEIIDTDGKRQLFFEGKLRDFRNCEIKATVFEIQTRQIPEKAMVVTG